MISQTRQRMIMAGMVVAAVALIAVGAVYQDDTATQGPTIVGGDALSNDDRTGAAQGGGDPAEPGAPPAVAVGPIEGFLPRSGEASACRESVGVDLTAGFGASLTINGIDIAPEQMNVNLDDEGNITNVITASRSLGHYTFEPDDNCPNGRFLRPVGNVLEVCIYRLEDTSQACSVRTENIFDAA